MIVISDAPIQLVHAYDPLLFGGSVVIAAFGGYVALWLIDRVGTLGESERSLPWLAAASAAMGIGIWSMHFTGMLALRLPVAVGYEPGLTLLSAVIAVLVSLLALAVVRRERVSAPRLAAASALMGVAIAGMHYTGMAAMRLPGEMHYRPVLVVASIAVGVLASGVALWLFLRHRDRAEFSPILGVKAVGGLLLGLAVSGLHYTAMSAARFRELRPDAPIPGEGLLLTEAVALWVGIASLGLLGLGLMAALLDRRLHRVYADELRRSRRRYETLLTEISDVVTVLDGDGIIRYESPSIEKVFGYAPDELVGRSVLDLVHPEDVDRVEKVLAGLASADEETVQYRFQQGDGSWRQVESTAVVSANREFGSLIVTRDITDRAAAQQKYRAIFETTPSAVGVSSLEDGRFVDVNPAFEDLFGYPRGRVVGSTSSELDLWADPEQRAGVVGRVRERRTVHNEEVQFRRADGEIVETLYSGALLEIGEEDHFLGVAKDISERKAFEEALQHQALHDQLTGLPNRELVRDRARQALRRADRRGDGLAVVYLDLDGFKLVNDEYGHPDGDRVLSEVAGRLQERTRDEDTLARMGGDEFLAVLEGLSRESDARRTAGRLLEAFQEPFPVPGGEVRLRASCGAVLVSPQTALSLLEGGADEAVGELVRQADRAMYAAKEQGGGRIQLMGASELQSAIACSGRF